MQITKHEIITCQRCGSLVECKANSISKCQCSLVQLSLNELQFVSECFDGCLCAECLLALQQEHQAFLKQGE